MQPFVSTNPSKNYQPIGTSAYSSLEEVQRKVAAAHQAKGFWRELGLAGRSHLLRQALSEIESQQESLARLIAQEMGMPLRYAREEILFGLDYFCAYLEQAQSALKMTVTFESDEEIDEVHREPYGVAGVIIAWNYPFSNFVWQCGQNLVAGNTIVLKHSEETPLFGQALESIFAKLLPPGVFNEIYGDGSVGEMLVSQPLNLLCFTGSTKTGLHLHQKAASRLLKTILELGGSAPGIVCPDADLTDLTVQALYNARFSNSGQMCDALKRLIVHESRYDELLALLQAKIQSARLGDAENEETTQGPLVSYKQLLTLQEQVQDALEKGAKVLIGGKQPAHLQGAYYEPTLLANITADMRIWQEEVFGPVLPVVTYRTDEEAIQLANDTRYGLGASIYTRDPLRYQRLAHALESGMVSQNSLTYVKPCNPFGGYKLSGQCRQHAAYGFHEVTQIKVLAREKTSVWGGK